MIFKQQKPRFIISAVVFLSFLFGSFTPQAQDLVPNEDLSLGSSVFVFRKSRTSPQLKSTNRRYFLRNSTSRVATPSRRFARNLAAGYKRRSTGGNATLVARNQKAKRNAAAARNKLSDTLTAKADVLLERKETDKAIETYKSALKNNPQNQTAKLGLSDAFVLKADETAAAGDSEAAKTFYQEAVKFDAANYAAYAKLGQTFERLQLKNDALTNYEKALRINSDMKDLFLPVANLYYEKEDYATTESYLAKAEANSGGANADTIFLRGLLHFRRNENEKALAAFAQTLTLDKNYTEAYFYQAEIYERLNKEREALAAYRKTVEIDPRFTQAWFDLGVANYNRGNYPEAETAYKKVIELDTAHPDAHANLASVYRQMKKYAAANGEYKIAAEYIKDDPDLFSEWGFCLGKVDEWEKAIARLQTASNLSPDAIDYTNLGWGYYNAAAQDLKAEKKAESQAKLAQGKMVLQKAVAQNPQFDAAQMNLGITFSGLGEYQNAVEALKKANNLHRNWLAAVNELGVAYRGLNNLTEAIAQFQKAVSLDDKFALGYFNLGEAQNKNGQKKEAQKTLKKLKQINPAMAQKLDSALSGKIINETKQKIKSKIPKLPF